MVTVTPEHTTDQVQCLHANASLNKLKPIVSKSLHAKRLGRSSPYGFAVVHVNSLKIFHLTVHLLEYRSWSYYMDKMLKLRISIKLSYYII